MRQVLWNLVRNGVQASGAGSRVRVAVREAKGDRVRLAVIDSGPGIAPGSQEKIFDAFFTTRSQGAGIGLAVVRRIIEDHAEAGATIDVRNNEGAEGGGATFEVGLARAASLGRRSTTAGSDSTSDPSDPAVTLGENARSQSERV
jgi:signal transduction histidine kinase